MAPGAFLPKRLATTAGHGRSIFLRLGAGARAGQVGDDHLVNQRLIKLDAEHPIGNRQRPTVSDLNFHRMLLRT